MKGFKPFQGAEHRTFKWAGGRPAALLVHGFPGTPAELRPLATALHRTGWTVHAPLLPGFGAQIETLFERDREEWVAEIRAVLAALQSNDHQPLLLVGYSVGAALALQAAAFQPPTALALLAPFWQLGSAWQQFVGWLLKLFVRRLRPFKKADFSDLQVRQGLSNFFPDLDLDDPEVQQNLRELAIPIHVFEQLHKLGQTAYRLAPRVSLPTLIVQGLEDEIVPRHRTRRLAHRLPGLLRYEEVMAGHNMINPGERGWLRVEQAVLRFAEVVQAEHW